MKHPNRKIEATSKFQAMARMKSCFRFWLGAKTKGFQGLTNARLIDAIINIQENYGVENAD